MFKLLLGLVLQPWLRFFMFKKLVSWMSFPETLTYAPGWWHQSLLTDLKSSTTWPRIRIIWIFYLLPVAVVDKIAALTISLIPLSWRYLFLSSSNEICGEHFFDLQSCLSSRSCLWESSVVCWISRPPPVWSCPNYLQFSRRDYFDCDALCLFTSTIFVIDLVLCFNQVIFVLLL